MRTRPAVAGGAVAEREPEEGLLARWSRRKAAARRREAAPEPSPATAAGPEQAAPAVQAPAPEDAPPPAVELPDPETLEAGADFKPFLKPGVPPELKRRALRRLWRIDPIYSRHDGLDDCCGDFTDQARVVRNLRTVYRVGRGMIERLAPGQAELPAPQTAAGPGEPPQVAAAAEPAPLARPDARQLETSTAESPEPHKGVSAAAPAGVEQDASRKPLEPAVRSRGASRPLPRRR